MAGSVLFKRGRHPSRSGRRAKKTMGPRDYVDLRSAIARRLGLVTSVDFQFLSEAILTARSFLQNSVTTGPDGGAVECEGLIGPMTRRDTVAQLKAMRRIDDDDALISALENIDAMTFSAIQQADLGLIADEISKSGHFVDSEGHEYLFPPSIESIPGFVYLPSGVGGLRQAVDVALETSEHRADRGGRKDKTHQSELERLCRYLWAKYCPSKSQRVWCTPDADRRSELVAFAKFVFDQAGMHLTDSRLVDVLKGRLS